MPVRGPWSVTVPGAIHSWGAAHERCGRLPWRTLLEPAIELAEGFAASDGWVRAVESSAVVFGTEGDWARTYRPHGHPWRPGQVVRLSALARSLRLIADEGVEAAYRGALRKTDRRLPGRCRCAHRPRGPGLARVRLGRAAGPGLPRGRVARPSAQQRGRRGPAGTRPAGPLRATAARRLRRPGRGRPALDPPRAGVIATGAGGARRVGDGPGHHAGRCRRGHAESRAPRRAGGAHRPAAGATTCAAALAGSRRHGLSHDCRRLGRRGEPDPVELPGLRLRARGPRDRHRLPEPRSVLPPRPRRGQRPRAPQADAPHAHAGDPAPGGAPLAGPRGHGRGDPAAGLRCSSCRQSWTAAWTSPPPWQRHAGPPRSVATRGPPRPRTSRRGSPRTCRPTLRPGATT